MKKQYYILFLCMAMLLGCNNIDSNNRLIEIPVATVERNVLVEEFTGQKCLNCPAAGVALKDIQSKYNEGNVVVVAIHGGPLALKSSDHIVGLRTDLSDQYYKLWKVSGVPCAVINRNSGVLRRNAWAAKIYEDLQQKSSIKIATKAQRVANSNDITISTTINNTGEAVKGHLQLWLVENNITAIQQLPNNDVQHNYVHNHVLRDAINGSMGEEVSLNSNTPQTFEHRYSAKANIDLNNCHIVAFLYNDSGVLQVVQQAVSNE